MLELLGPLPIIKRYSYAASDFLTASTGKSIGLIDYIKALIEIANFDPSLIGDPNFIGEIKHMDEPEMVAGAIKPTHILSVISATRLYLLEFFSH